MTIAEMHYDFKMKLNKLDSKQHRNLLIPEIDWLLNEAQELFVKLVANPRMAPGGFETSQRSIDDLRMLVADADAFWRMEEEDKEARVKKDADLDQKLGRLVVMLPTNYLHHVRSRFMVKLPSCETPVECVVRLQQHDDTFEEDPFTKSSYAWREVNAVFAGDKLTIFLPDGKHAFRTKYECSITYLKKPAYIHYAEGWNATKGYNLPGRSEALKGKQDCELPDHTHREIVDLAVLCASEQLELQSFQTKLAKLQLHNLVKQ